MFPRWGPFARAALVLLVLAGSWIPGAQAQETENWTLSAAVGSIPGPIPPGPDNAVATVRVDWSCQQGSIRTTTDPEPITYAATVDQSWATILLGRSGDDLGVTAAECANGVEGFSEVPVLISVNESATYGDIAIITFTTELPDRGLTASAEFQVTAGHYFKAAARFINTSFEARPDQEVVITGSYENNGNAPLTVLLVTDDSDEGLEVLAPKSITVDPFSAKSFVITVLTPQGKGAIDRTDTVVVRFDANVVGNESAKDKPLELSASIHIVQTAVKESPGPTPLFALIALGLVAWRRRTAGTRF